MKSQGPGTTGKNAVLAIDVGGTTLKGSVFDDLGNVLDSFTVGTFSVDGTAMAGVRALISNLITSANVRGIFPGAIGIASPGLVDSSAGIVAYATNLAWDAMPLKKLLEADFGLDVVLEHDARAGSLAERSAREDAAPDFLNFLFIPIGTGVAASVITSGVTVLGATGAAGEFGHMPIMYGDEICACGQRGCIEAYASASSILDRYRTRGGTAASTPEVVAALGSDPLARQIWDEAVEALSIGIASLTAVLDPAVVVIGGGLSNAGHVLLDPLRERVDSKLGWRRAPQIVQSMLGSHAGLIGAALLARGVLPTNSVFSRTAHASLQARHIGAPNASLHG